MQVGMRVSCRSGLVRIFSPTRQIGTLLQNKVVQEDAIHRTGVLGVPMHLGQPITGVEQGPGLLREAGLHQRLASIGWDVDDMGDVDVVSSAETDEKISPDYGNAKSCYAIGKNMEKTASMVSDSMKKNDFTLILGGDHTIACGSIAGVLQDNPDTGIIWVDAHADLNTPQSSPSGNMHGMPLSLLVPGLVDHSRLPGFEWLKNGPTFDASRQLVYIGLRDLDPGEIKLIRERGILTFTMHDIDRFGIGEVVRLALAHLEGRSIHLSYDIDALDPIVTPSTGTRVPGGLTLREGHFVAESLQLSGKLRSMDMVEVNPFLSTAVDVQQTVKVALDLVLSAMGDQILTHPRLR